MVVKHARWMRKLRRRLLLRHRKPEIALIGGPMTSSRKLGMNRQGYIMSVLTAMRACIMMVWCRCLLVLSLSRLCIKNPTFYRKMSLGRPSRMVVALVGMRLVWVR